MSINEQYAEYTIEVPRRGYIGRAGRLHISGGSLTLPTYESMADALLALDRNAQHYRDMGVPEIAETLRVVTRTITVTRSDWEPVDMSKSDE